MVYLHGKSCVIHISALQQFSRVTMGRYTNLNIRTFTFSLLGLALYHTLLKVLSRTPPDLHFLGLANHIDEPLMRK